MKLILSMSAVPNVVKYAQHLVRENELDKKFPDLNVVVFFTPALTSNTVCGGAVYDPVSDKIMWSQVEGDAAAQFVVQGWNKYFVERGDHKRKAVTLAYNTPMESV